RAAHLYTVDSFEHRGPLPVRAGGHDGAAKFHRVQQAAREGQRAVIRARPGQDSDAARSTTATAARSTSSAVQANASSLTLISTTEEPVGGRSTQPYANQVPSCSASASAARFRRSAA